MNIDDTIARRRFVDAYAKLTVWVRQTSNGKWEAVDWYGKVMAEGALRADVERAVKDLSHDASKNIYAIATIVAPQRRRQHYSKPTRRMP